MGSWGMRDGGVDRMGTRTQVRMGVRYVLCSDFVLLEGRRRVGTQLTSLVLVAEPPLSQPTVSQLTQLASPVLGTRSPSTRLPNLHHLLLPPLEGLLRGSPSPKSCLPLLVRLLPRLQHLERDDDWQPQYFVHASPRWDPRRIAKTEPHDRRREQRRSLVRLSSPRRFLVGFGFLLGAFVPSSSSQQGRASDVGLFVGWIKGREQGWRARELEELGQRLGEQWRDGQDQARRGEAFRSPLWPRELG